jgi:hypothetical protein
VSYTRPKKPVSETIASGFFASRSVIIPPQNYSRNREATMPNILEMYSRLSKIALQHPGVVLDTPRGHGQAFRDAEVRLTNTPNIRNNAALIGHLIRRDVYDAIRSNVPSFSQRISDVVAEDVKLLDSPSDKSSGGSVLRVGLGSLAQLGYERAGIRSTVAGLAGVAVDELNWGIHFPSLEVATFPAGTSDEAPAAMQAILEEYTPFTIDLRVGRLIPALR